MVVLIPMGGTGARYQRAGYTQPKPLIPVDGRRMIERIVEGFGPSAKFLFAVRGEHLDTTDVEAVLRHCAPGAPIVRVPDHKDGPVRTLLSIRDAIPQDEAVVVNYCDFGVEWSYPAFQRWFEQGGWDGGMTAYRGFHPHSLGPTLYAYMRNDGDRVVEIREKHHFTPDKFSEYASTGLYAFRTGRVLIETAEALEASGARVNGEQYVSMMMQTLIERGGRVGVHEVERFFQWGTPEDLHDWESWARGMRALDARLDQAAHAHFEGTLVIPAAGFGQRFADAGYRDPKPMIPVAGIPMIEAVIRMLPRARRIRVVTRAGICDAARWETALRAVGTPFEIQWLDAPTDGQACTTLEALRGLPDAEPVMVVSCDTGLLIDPDRVGNVLRSGAEQVVITGRGHLPALWRPQQYGWTTADGTGRITGVGVKQTLPGVPVAEQGVVTGAFAYASAGLARARIERLVASGERVNGEFYLDTVARQGVAHGEAVFAVEAEKFMPWGTPAELQTFDYWNAVHRRGAPFCRRS